MSLIDDGNQEQPTGGTESPTSSPSGSQQGQQLSDVSALVKTVEELRKELRGIQKGTDKRFEKFGGDIKRVLELKEQGLDENGIKRELFLDSLIAGQGQDAPPPTPVGNESQRQAPDVESAFRTVEEYELSTNDPEFLALLRGVSRMDKATFDGKVKDYILGKKKPPKPANPADVVQSPARAGATEKSKEALQSEYLKEMAGARGKGYQVGDAIKEKYRKQGLNVDEIVIRV
jgi:hypothetical protein